MLHRCAAATAAIWAAAFTLKGVLAAMSILAIRLSGADSVTGRAAPRDHTAFENVRSTMRGRAPRAGMPRRRESALARTRDTLHRARTALRATSARTTSPSSAASSAAPTGFHGEGRNTRLRLRRQSHQARHIETEIVRHGHLEHARAPTASGSISCNPKLGATVSATRRSSGSLRAAAAITFFGAVAV